MRSLEQDLISDQESAVCQSVTHFQCIGGTGTSHLACKFNDLHYEKCTTHFHKKLHSRLSTQDLYFFQFWQITDNESEKPTTCFELRYAS